MGHLSTQPETHEDRPTDAPPIPDALQWVKEHGDEHAGRWVAIGACGLAAEADTLAELKAKLGGSLKGVVIDHLV